LSPFICAGKFFVGVGGVGC